MNDYYYVMNDYYYEGIMVFLAFGIIIGMFIGAYLSDGVWEDKMIKMGIAEYDNKSGRFHIIVKSVEGGEVIYIDKKSEYD